MIFEPDHLNKQNVSYLRHMCFALVVALRMLLSAGVLIFHALIPIIRVPEFLTILGTSNYLYDKHLKILDLKLNKAERSQERLKK